MCLPVYIKNSKKRCNLTAKQGKIIKGRKVCNSQANAYFLLITPPMGICLPSASQRMHVFQLQLLRTHGRIHLRDARHVITDTTHPAIMYSV